MGKLQKTSVAYCKGCKYNMVIAGENIACNYMQMTKKRRGCPVGLCDKKESKKRRTKWSYEEET